MWSQSKVQHWCFFTQMFYSLSAEGCMFMIAFLLRTCSTSTWTNKTVTRRLLLFPFVTGKHKVACYQIKQDELKNPQVAKSLETTFRSSILSRSNTRLDSLSYTQENSSAMMTWWDFLRPAVYTEACTSGDSCGVLAKMWVSETVSKI